MQVQKAALKYFLSQFSVQINYHGQISKTAEGEYTEKQLIPFLRPAYQEIEVLDKNGKKIAWSSALLSKKPPKGSD